MLLDTHILPETPITGTVFVVVSYPQGHRTLFKPK